MNARDTNKLGMKLSLLAIMLSAAMLMGCARTSVARPQGVARASTLPDLSGPAWVEDDLFVGVHDAKRNPEKASWPRVSLVRLPKSDIDGVAWESLDLKFPGPEGTSRDMVLRCKPEKNL